MNPRQLHLIVLSADATIGQIVAERAEAAGRWRVDAVTDAAGLLGRITPTTEMLVIDEAAADGGYVSLIKRARRTDPTADAIVIGGPKSEEVRAAERRDGVDRYHERPLDAGAFAASLSHRLDFVALKADAGIVGRSSALEEVLEAILQVAPTEVPILLEGESGTGKDVIARAIHGASRRAGRPFEAINCGALAEGVLESELFGHEKGAFTGAVSRRPGMFERADGGTIFLDEVGETSPNMQVRLLRVLESGEVLRVGGVGAFSVNVRVIAATNRSLGEAVRNGSFRQDLYYRLKGVNLFLPPLRNREDDIPLLVQTFIAQANRQHSKSVRGVEPAAMSRLIDYDWPGNVRELRNLVDTLVVLAPGPRITRALVDAHLDSGAGAYQPSPLLPVALNRAKDEAEREMIYASILALHRDVREILEHLKGGAARPWDSLKEVRVEEDETHAPLELGQLERAAIQEALQRFNGNRRRAADALGISERTLYRKIKQYGLI